MMSFGHLDCAFNNNAGIAAYQVDAAGKCTHEWSEQSFDRMIAVNLKGVWLAMKAELEIMSKQKSGAIVNTASIAGRIGLPTSSGYVAAKHGVVGLTDRRDRIRRYRHPREFRVPRFHRDRHDARDDVAPRQGDHGDGAFSSYGHRERDRRDGLLAVLRPGFVRERRQLQRRRQQDEQAGGVSTARAA